MKTIKSGLVAFFDILGYQGLVNNNLIEYAAELISSQLSNLPKQLYQSQFRKFEDVFKLTKPDASRTASFVSTIVLSDSILLTVNIKESDPAEEQLVGWLVFSMLCKEVFEKMFENGLPLNGAIGYGKFFRKSNCFAGKSIMEAYELQRTLDLSACVLTHSASEKLNNLLAVESSKIESLKTLLNGCYVKYIVPLKDTSHREMPMIKLNKDIFIGKDIRQVVFESFSRHNKVITKDERSKVENTEMMLRFLTIENIKQKS